ncbi:serine protease HtrA [Alkaliphilus serpentinus]|uniref:PDZ domain-containing protein n=1 Tax=Alkaliphilus serpentinus TaxID=1482731 RepID=A0A833HQV4_9FIRM|nr:trypsin-like peptidase domain-containing protein [Alkaliphilus serpentinus]KAB3532175.1 PDZ domain-containing protein [Alkaliphilus serpentinus]
MDNEKKYEFEDQENPHETEEDKVDDSFTDENPLEEDSTEEKTPQVVVDSTIVKKSNKPPRRSKFSMLLLILIGALLGSGITMGAGYYYLPEVLNMRGISLAGNQQQITIEPTEDLTVYTAVAKKAMPSVVGITSTTLQQTVFGVRKAPSLGTGVIVDDRGYILTNSHVVGDGDVEEIMVILHDGQQLPAKVIWNEISLDLAVIKVEAENKLPVAELGDSDSLEVGEIAVAIGNPMGLNFERTLTQGVISGLNRIIQMETDTIENLIQTDASINPGNSGGPLLNARGQVIGINTIKVRTGEGLGFAIPINTAKPIVEQIIETGEFTRVYLGITPINVEDFENATGVDLSIDSGIYVVRVFEDSPAERFGLLAGDVILKIGEAEVKTVGSLLRELYRYRPGDEVVLTVNRGNEEVEIEITFD